MKKKDDFKLTIIDYGSSNLYSVINACKTFGIDPVVSNDHAIIKSSDAVILPGVGAFNEAMSSLEKLDLIEPIKEFVHSGKPFMGICLGLHLLFERSEEFGDTKGLGLVKGSIKKFPSDKEQNLKVPQIAWNKINSVNNNNWEKSPFATIQEGTFMYFVHSFYADAEDPEVILSETEYNNVTYCSSILKNNIFATQFHPEKSGDLGLEIYKNWFSNIIQ
ncbi:imidazole glycerol phosphate synthase subunit HisH [Aquimarina sp. 2304DJ70-9]|uniref:imidazole glycerol phosphate synthase subunit HisH n=1 Tax=Aquimarina penaris TaxID=3231044 RepID=UPI0034632E2E